MKRRNKILPAVLSTTMVVSMIPTTAFAGTSYVAKSYQGTAIVYCDEDEDFWDYAITVDVPVSEDGKIGTISVISAVDQDNQAYMNKALNGTKSKVGVVSQLSGKTVSEVLSATSIDAVSGATCASDALLSAVQNALASVETIDTSALEIAIASVSELKEEDYTAESWAAMQTALTAAQNALTAKESQAAITSAADELKAAVAALEKKTEADTAKLEEAIKKAEELKEADYSAESWKTFSDVLKEAKEALTAKKSQDAVDAALKKLEDAEKALVKYVVMNVPYNAFYSAYGVSDKAVWEVESGVDAVSTATTSKFLGTTGLANGTYNNGKYIMGVTIPVAVECGVLDDLGTSLTVNDNYYYTACESTPSYYSTVTKGSDGSLSFSKMAVSGVDTSQLSIEDVITTSSYGDYQISLAGVGTNKTITTASGSVSYNAIYGAILNTDQGSFGMTALENMWFGTKTPDIEIAWSIVGGKGLQRGHGAGDAFYQFAMNGGTLNSVQLITDLGVITVSGGVSLPVYYTDTESLANLKYSIDNDSTVLNITGVPEKLQDVTVSVSGGLATDAQIVDGKVELTKAPTAGTSYTLTINSSNYSAITRTMSTPITEDQKTQLNAWVEKAKATTGYDDNTDLKEHVAEAEALVADADATSVDAASLISELKEKVKATYDTIPGAAVVLGSQKATVSMDVALSDLENPTYKLTTGSGRGMKTVASGTLDSLEISLSTAISDDTVYTLTIIADNYKDTAVEAQKSAEIDTSKLEAAITAAEELKEADYSADSWTAFSNALKDAKEALSAKESQDAVDAALTKLEDAEKALVKYVVMNVPYNAFYSAYGVSDKAVWEVESGVDAVSTATTSKFLGTTGLANGTYNNGKYIMGVTIPVAVECGVLDDLGTSLTVNDNYYYTACESTPAYYSTVTKGSDGTLSFSKMAASGVDTSQLSIEDVITTSGYGDYQISLAGVGTDKTITTADGSVSYNAIYGAILNTDQGSFGMTCLENLWYGNKVPDVEIAWSIVGGKGLQRGHGAGDAFYQFAMNGGTLNSVDLITDLGVITVSGPVSLSEYYTDTESLANLKYSIDNDSNVLNITGVPEKLQDVTVSVSGGLATDAQIVDGKVELTKAPTAGTSYTLTINSSNYSAITRTMSTPITEDQKTQLNAWVEKAKATTGYDDNTDLKEHVAEAEALVADADATSVDAASLISELKEKVKATYDTIPGAAAVAVNQKMTVSMDVALSDLENPTYKLTTGSGRGMQTVASGTLDSLEISLSSALSEDTVYTLTIMADNYKDTAVEPTVKSPEKDMTSLTIGGVSYYYVNTKDDADNTVYKVSVTTGRGASAKTTVTEYKKTDLTQAASSDYYYIVAPGATALTGTLYGTKEGTGTKTTYTEVYTGLGALASDPAYDCVSSATGYTSFHAKDISSTVTYGTDASGSKAITGLETGKASASVDAVKYVEASVLKAAGEELTEDQTAALDIQLKKNPMSQKSSDTIQVTGTATWTTSRYGTGEFAIVPDESVEGYNWSEYWDNVYAATVSDGTTTVGAVHWIDLYGEDSTSGAHYNKIELALNNGTSVGANAAEVSRYAAFYDENTGSVKPGTYTITVYADGYSPLTTEVTIAAEAMTSTSIGGVTYYYADTTDDAAGTVYQASVTTGRGPSAKTTVYNYTKADLTQAGDSNYYYIAAPGATALTGTLYGTDSATGKETNYKEVYTGLSALSDDPAYDAVSSATGFTSFHAKDISSTVTYGTDASGNKAITGLKLNKTAKTVDAKAYVDASVLKAAGADLTDEQTEALNITLKQNPMTPAASETVAVSLSEASWSTSRYGDGEFVIVPDETVSGYVWSEYWDNVYAATVSDGTTTVGAVHWIDLYGEASTSGAHYNKIELALNNGTSVGANAAEVSRYAAFYDANTGNIKPGTYTITIKADGYSDLTAEVTIPSEAMSSTTVGGVTYYYADTEDDDANTVYQVSVTTGRGPSAVTTVYNYKKSDLTQVGDSNVYMIAAPGSTALTGTLYGYGDGTASNYKTVYAGKATSLDDPAYDCVSSATGYTSFHAKDISSTVTYGTDASGNKAITGLSLNKAVKTADADAYVAASILKAAGKDLTEEQTELLKITLKPNPTNAPSESEVKVTGTATWTTSRYGTGEFAIVPDESATGYVWSEYWDKVYGATVSDGTTTVGAVHWIDLYGEASTSGAHYNKIELALNNGTSVGANAASVSRYAAFYNADGNIKPGTYTITVFAEGYSDLTVTAEIGKYEQTVTADKTSISGTVGDDPVTITASAKTAVTYASSDESVATVDENGKVSFKKAGSAVITVSAPADATYQAASIEIPVTVAAENITITDATVEYGSKDDVKITCSRKYDLFTGLTMDGKELTKDTDYTVAAGSTDVTLKGSYVSTLAVGKHDLVFLYSDQTNVPTTVTVTEKKSDDSSSGSKTSGGSSSGTSVSGGTSSTGTTSGTTSSKGSSTTSSGVNTGDTTNMTLWASMFAIAVAALGVFGFRRKKEEDQD